MPYDPTIFRGAAAHYRDGRPPYSPQLEAVLCEELGLDEGLVEALHDRGDVVRADGVREITMTALHAGDG